jgi:dihydropteroate synthase
MILRLGDHTLDLGERCHVMGVINLTPDSFYHRSRYTSVTAALRRAVEMKAEGADIIDIGGESTRPGAAAVEPGEELDRVAPVVEAILGEVEVPVSVDTRRASVAGAALELGAHMVNDVSGLTNDPEMAEVVREAGVPVVLMHMRGSPSDMQSYARYDDVLEEVSKELRDRIEEAEDKGIAPDRIVVDPGIGFAKKAEHSVEILARLDELAALNKPILVGASRKSFIGKTLGLEPDQRLEATLAACVLAASAGARIFRVHDVEPTVRALRMYDTIAAMKVEGTEQTLR